MIKSILFVRNNNEILSSLWINKNKIRYAIASLHLLRTCSIFAPNLSSMIFGSSTIYFTEFTFWLSNISLNWFIYKSNHLARFPIEKRLTYSSFVSTIFNFGSIMIVHNLSHFFGRTEPLRLISSLTLSSCLLSIGSIYFDDINNNNNN